MTRDELITALEAAKGPDLQLDLEIEAIRRTIEAVKGQVKVIHVRIDEEGSPHEIAPAYTASRDAMLPGAEKLVWDISGPHGDGWWATGYRRHRDPVALGVGNAATEPLARRIAEIKALVPAQ